MRTLLALALMTLTACGPPVPEPSAERNTVEVRFEPDAEPTHVSNVLHIHVKNAGSNSAVSLFEGSLSSYYLGKVRQGDIPETLAARQVPLLVWGDPDEWTVAPLEALQMASYSLVSAEGLVTEFQVSSALPLLQRLWPVAGVAGSARFAVYCQDGATGDFGANTGSLVLEPRELAVELAPGVDRDGAFSERCLHFESDAELADGELLVAPPVLGAWALAPALFSSTPMKPQQPMPCREGEVPFGPGCATSADDRVVVRTPTSALLWILHTDRGALVEVTGAGSPLTVPGLSPNSRVHLWGNVHDEAGSVFDIDLEIGTAQARERPILNEALADALGPEPKSEWLELFNDGTLAVDLAKYTLKDGGGVTPLPHAWLGPKEYALLVREDFEPNGSDEPPSPKAHLVRVPTLGKAGFSNKGEQLSLLDEAGRPCSVLPAVLGKPGQSIARLTPAAPDDDPNSFSVGTPTPGFSNALSPRIPAN